MLARLAQRAQQSGRLRADFAIDDLVLALRAGRGLAVGDDRSRERAARRFCALLIDAFAVQAPARR
jgi:hypothetical protein